METPVQTTDILIAAIDVELKALLQSEVSNFKAVKEALQNDKKVV